MTWKKVVNADSGTADKSGGSDLDKVVDAFNGVDVSDPIIYNTDSNTLRANTNAAGDLLKNNGTKFVRMPRGTANQVLRVNSTGTDLEYATPAAASSATYQPYSYLIYKGGSTYYARNGITGNIDYSNTNVVTLFNNTITALVAGSATHTGGRILVKGDTTYPVGEPITVGHTTYPNALVEIIGENRDNTIIQATGTGYHVMELWSNAIIRNLTVDAADLANSGILSGQPIRGEVYNCRIKRHRNFGIWLAGSMKSVVIENNIFEGPTTYEDQCAFTCTEWGICRHNYFNRLTGYTNGESLTSGGPWNNVVIQSNIFDRDPVYIRNAISLEDASTLPYTNVVIDSNVCKNGSIWVGGITAFTTVYNGIVVTNNVINGAEINVLGPTDYDPLMADIIVANNIVRDSYNSGIRINRIKGGPISVVNNTIINSNRSLNTGIAFHDHELLTIKDTSYCLVQGNRLHMTDNSTYGSPIGIYVDNLIDSEIINNVITNTTSKPSYQAAGTNTNLILRGNRGYKTEAEGATSIADGGTISHGLASTPTVVTVTPSVASEFASVTDKTSTTFTVAIKTHANSAGTTQTIYWRASI
jgi:hypothetical protein